MERLSNEIKDHIGSNDPYHIAAANQIAVIAEPLGNIHGYFSDLKGQKIIHLNDGLHPSMMDYVTSYLLGNLFIDGFNGRFCIPKSHELWSHVERNAHKFANYLLDRTCNTVMEQLSALNENEIVEISACLDRIWCKDSEYRKINGIDKLQYVLKKFL